MTKQSPSKNKKQFRWGLTLAFILTPFILITIFQATHEVQYRNLKKEAQSFGVLITAEDFQKQRQSITASTDLTDYIRLHTEFQTNPVLAIDSKNSPIHSPQQIRKQAPWLFDHINKCVSIPTTDDRPYTTEDPPLYFDYKFTSGIPKILTNDILHDIDNNNLDRAPETAQSLYGWLDFLYLNYHVTNVNSHMIFKTWLDSAEAKLKTLPSTSPQAKTLADIVTNTPDPPSLKRTFLSWHSAPQPGNTSTGETPDEYGQRLYDTYKAAGKFTTPIETAKNYLYFNTPGYATRKHKLFLQPMVNALKKTPYKADDITLATAIDAEFTKAKKSKRPGWVEINDGIPNFYTYLAQQRQDLIDRKSKIANHKTP